MNAAPSTPSPSTVTSVRVFAAPPERIFQAFADPRELAQWWGPAGFTTTIKDFDLRPGGWWHLVMHGPDGAHYVLTKQFVEVTPPSKVVFDHIQSTHQFRMTMTFAESAGGTLLRWEMKFASPSEYERVGAFVAGANEQNFDRLAAHLAAISQPKP